MSQKPSVVLVVGACALDRLLTVASYPAPDAKVRTTAYNEGGGGNAANTAAAMGLLTTAGIWKEEKKKKCVIIKLLTKVGDDTAGQQLLDELEASHVDTTSPLCMKGPPGSTTGLCTTIVSEQEHTRTCLFTHGTCGELTEEDVQSVDMDVLFEDVVHFHSDSRHTEATLLLAKEAKQRGIPVSCDSEKDRKSKALDELLAISDLVFTNASYKKDYIQRMHSEMEAKTNRPSLPEPSVMSSIQGLGQETINVCSKSLTPSIFFNRWHDEQPNKQVVVTQGHMGALHFQPWDISSMVATEGPFNDLTMGEEDGNFYLYHRYNETIDGKMEMRKTDYQIQMTGVIDNVNIVDTTGAGDAFIAGYLMAHIAIHSVPFAMRFGAWVGGKKLEGPGARSALPKGADVDEHLGVDKKAVFATLNKILSSFNKEDSLREQNPVF